jgi:hypothetical protein
MVPLACNGRVDLRAAALVAQVVAKQVRRDAI